MNIANYSIIVIIISCLLNIIKIIYNKLNKQKNDDFYIPNFKCSLEGFDNKNVGKGSSQALYTNMDTKMLYDSKNVSKQIEYNFDEFNEPEKTLDKYNIEFNLDLAENERVYDTFIINKKEKNKKKIVKEQLPINDINYLTAEENYKKLFNYKIGPINMEEWFLPANYVEYSEYNKPSIKSIINRNNDDNNNIRAYNWSFGLPLG
jgi:hypothetical protein